MRRNLQRVAVLTSVAALALTACGREDSGGGSEGGGEEGSVASGPGITSEPCPEAVDEAKGCIYLGLISDLTGAFKGVGVPLTEGQKSFWETVNEAGGIGDYEVNVTEYIRDNVYSPDTQAQVYNEIKDEILALGQSLGTAQTNAILDDAIDENIAIVPASLGSNWLFEDTVMEFGAPYCAEAMNIVDYAVDELGAKSVAAVHFPGDYGDDAAVGAQIAADERGISFTDIPTGPGGDQEQTAAVAAVLKSKADVVVVATGPIELATIVGGAAAQGFTGKFIGSVPSWNSALLATPAGPALEALYLQASSVGPWDTETAGHNAMREAGSSAEANDWYVAGWASSYAMKTALETALEAGDLSREGVVKAIKEITSVDTEGMLPEGSGNFAGDPNQAVVRTTLLNKVTPKTSTGVSVEVEAFTGPTAEAYEFTEACYLQK